MGRSEDDVEQLIERHRRAIEAYDFKSRVDATWALVRAGAGAIPAVVALLHSPNADIREDAAGILGALGRSEGVVQSLVEALGREHEPQSRDTAIMALGQLKSRDAIPALAPIIRDDAEDADTRLTAVQSLGQIVGRRFDRRRDPYAAAVEWLDRHGQ